MVGFLSRTNDPQRIIKSSRDIFFVHIPDRSDNDAIKRFIAPIAKLFAEKIKKRKVYLHFGKEIITYDIKV